MTYLAKSNQHQQGTISNRESVYCKRSTSLIPGQSTGKALLKTIKDYKSSGLNCNAQGIFIGC
jgi:hypothetical protein